VDKCCKPEDVTRICCKSRISYTCVRSLEDLRTVVNSCVLNFWSAINLHLEHRTRKHITLCKQYWISFASYADKYFVFIIVLCYLVLLMKIILTLINEGLRILFPLAFWSSCSESVIRQQIITVTTQSEQWGNEWRAYAVLTRRESVSVLYIYTCAIL
jgi:hypothetical protein